MTITLYIFTALVEVVVYHNIFYAFSGGKFASTTKRVSLCALYAIVNVLSCTFLHFLPLHLIILVALVVLMSTAYKMDVQRRVLACFSGIFLCVALEFSVGLILSVVWNVNLDLVYGSKIYTTASVVIVKSVTLVASYIIKHSYKIKQGTVSKIQLIPYILSVLMSIFVLDEVFTIAQKTGGVDLNGALFIISTFVLASNVVLFLSFEYVLKVSKEKNDLQLSQLKLQSERVRYEDITQSQKQIAKKLHDVKNQMFGLKELIEAGDPKAMEYINEICEMQNLPTEVFTGVHSIDGILKSKQETAKSRGVHLNIKSSLKIMGTVDAIDVCVIIGNLLDNGMDSAQNQEDKTVLFDISHVRNYIKIVVKNTCGKNVDVSNLQTSKKDKLFHGNGIANVKEIVSKNNGIINFQACNGWFEVVVLLKN